MIKPAFFHSGLISPTPLYLSHNRLEPYAPGTRNSSLMLRCMCYVLSLGLCPPQPLGLHECPSLPSLRSDGQFLHQHPSSVKPLLSHTLSDCSFPGAPAACSSCYYHAVHASSTQPHLLSYWSLSSLREV